MTAALILVAAGAWAGGGAAPRPRPPAWAVAVLPSGHEFSLEVAADPESRARGYMGRDRVGPREGMLFVFDDADLHAFWMKNCKVRLDIVWLDDALRIVHAARDLPPCPADGDCPSVAPSRPARFVLEFAAGTAAREGLKPGDVVGIVSDPPIR